jgi:brefeldin A-inhibited guanine nucleotide-exchange protein
MLLQSAGPSFRRHERFVGALRQYLCVSLLKNGSSSLPAAMQLSTTIFLSLVAKFRHALKAS